MLRSQTQLNFFKNWFPLPTKYSRTEGSSSNWMTFHQDIIISNTASERQENTIVNEFTDDRHFTVGTSGNNLMTNENTVKVKTLEKCFNKKVGRKMSNIVDAVKDRI